MLLYTFGREYVVPESQVQGHGGKPRNVFVNRDLGKNPSYITCFCEQFWENLISFSTGEDLGEKYTFNMGSPLKYYVTWGKPNYLTCLLVLGKSNSLGQ